MAITYKWSINQMNAHIQAEGKDNVIYTVHWTYSGSEESGGKTYSNSLIGAQGFTYVKGDPFVPYANTEAFEKVVMVEEFPKASIRVDMQVVEAHAGTRCAAMTAAAVALAEAGIPMRDMIPACASGKVNDVVVLDLNKEEDNYGQADLPLAIIPSTGEVVLLQLDGHLTPDEFELAMDLATSGCMDLYEKMRHALENSYGGKK